MKVLIPGSTINGNSALRHLQNSNAKYGIVYQDTNGTLKPNHFFLIGKDSRNSWRNLDHASSEVRGDDVKWRRTYRLYYYKK